MRALFITSPGLSHMFPTVPLAHALRAAGHEVRYATGGHVHAVTDAGLCLVDVTPGVDYAKLFVPDDDDVKDPMHSEDLGIGFFARMFGRVSSVAVDGALAFARSWSPDLVLCTPTQGTAPLVATALGVPCVQMPLGPADDLPGLDDTIRDAMADDYARHGVKGEPPVTVRITSIPPSMESRLNGERAEKRWPMRYVPYNGGAVLPDWLYRGLGRPRIAVTLGSIDGVGDGIAVLKPLVAAARDVDAEFVLTVGGGDLSLLGELSDNIRTVDWIPLAALLETCAAIIHHGGSGTMLTAVAAGVPQCVIPHGSYQDSNRDVLSEAGIGFATAAASLGADDCRQLLDEPSFRDAARELRDELLTMPAPSEIVPRLTELVGR